MKSQITLRKQQLPFTQVPNELLCNQEISSLAKTLWCVLYSKPDNWTFFWGEILTHFKEGRDAVKKASKELEKVGYFRKNQLKRNQNGKMVFGGMEIELFCSPVTPDQQNQGELPITDFQLTETPSSEIPLTENQSTYKYLNKKDLSNKYLNKKTPPTPSSPNQEEKSVLPHHQFGVLENGRDLINKITDKTLVKAKENAPGWDIYYLADVYVEGISKRGMPDNLNLAFPEWCTRYTKGKRP
jgi:hypothetical protein